MLITRDASPHSTYKNCRAVIDTLNNTTPEACANCEP